MVHIGVGIGGSTFEGREDAAGAGGDSSGGKGTSKRVLFGYRPLDYLGVDVACQDLGSGFDDDDNEELFAGDGLSLAVLGIVSLSEKSSFFVEAGVFSWDFEESQADGSDRSSTDGSNLMFGFGWEHRFADQWSARAEWKRFDEVGSNDDPSDDPVWKADIDKLAVSLSFNF